MTMKADYGAVTDAGRTDVGPAQEVERRASQAAHVVSVAPAGPAEPGAVPRNEEDVVIARGGMGVIYRIFDRAIGRFAAMKVLDPAIATPELAHRFAVEARITGQLDHPNIVPVYSFAVDEGGAPKYFTMKLVEGETLTQAIARMARPRGSDGDELWRLLHVFLKVCDAVAFAHSRGVIHCDIKPDNVMLGTFGQVYVMDWGIARVMGADADAEAPSVMGTPIYMSPEQAWGAAGQIDPRTDVFALGGVLYQMITGEPPYSAATPTGALELARRGQVRDPAELEDAVPSAPLWRVAMKALSPEPSDRYPNVAELRADVEALLRDGMWLGLRTFLAGRVIVREGEEGDAAYVVTKGRCAVYRSIQGAHQLIREMHPGEAFGEMALIGSRLRSATVVAIEDVTAIVVTREVLERELSARSWLGALVRSLAGRFREFEDRMMPSSGSGRP